MDSSYPRKNKIPEVNKYNIRIPELQNIMTTQKKQKTETETLACIQREKMNREAIVLMFRKDRRQTEK